MNDREFDAWLHKIPVLTEPRTSDEEQALQELIGGKGLTVLLGLLFGTRQALYASLSYQSMGKGDGRWRAAVTQGKIQGIELVVQTMRELAVPVSSETNMKEPK